MRRASAVLLILVGFMAGSLPAGACSCVPIDARARLRSADAAIVGKAISRRTSSLGGLISGRAYWQFRVEEVLTGEVPRTVQVVSAELGASCGLEVELGERVGLLLERRGDIWESGLCSTVDADALIAASKPVSPPDGEGPIAMIAFGSFGWANSVALDSQGGPLAYGAAGSEEIGLVSVCPGSRNVAELLSGGTVVAIRDLQSFQIVRRLARIAALQRGQFDEMSDMACIDEQGGTVVVAASESRGDSVSSTLLRVDSEGVEEVAPAEAGFAALHPSGRAVLQGAGPNGAELAEVDLATGVRKPIGIGPKDLWPGTLSPDGRTLATFRGTVPGPGEILIIDTFAFSMEQSPRTPVPAIASLQWADDETLVYQSHEEHPKGTIFNASLQKAGIAESWETRDAVAIGDRIYGIVEGTLISVERTGGDLRRLRTFEGGSGRLVAVPQPAPTVTDEAREVPDLPGTRGQIVAAPQGLIRPWMWFAGGALALSGLIAPLLVRRRRRRREA